MSSSIKYAQRPDALRGLRACKTCKLIKTLDQFIETFCENCWADWANGTPASSLPRGRKKDAAEENTTTDYEGFVAMMRPDNSWVARWLRMHVTDQDDGSKINFKPGLYAISLPGEEAQAAAAAAEEKADEYEDDEEAEEDDEADEDEEEEAGGRTHRSAGDAIGAGAGGRSRSAHADSDEEDDEEEDETNETGAVVGIPTEEDGAVNSRVGGGSGSSSSSGGDGGGGGGGKTQLDDTEDAARTSGVFVERDEDSN